MAEHQQQPPRPAPHALGGLSKYPQGESKGKQSAETERDTN